MSAMDILKELSSAISTTKKTLGDMFDRELENEPKQEKKYDEKHGKKCQNKSEPKFKFKRERKTFSDLRVELYGIGQELASFNNKHPILEQKYNKVLKELEKKKRGKVFRYAVKYLAASNKFPDKNPMKRAAAFANEAMKQICGWDDHFIIEGKYTIDGCPVKVDFYD